MEPFEFKVDTSTIYMKALNAFGFIILGFAIGITIYKFKIGEPIDWMNSITLFSSGILFLSFPRNLSQNAILFNEQGIFLKNYGLEDYEPNKIYWDKISSIRIEKNQLSIKKIIGTSQKIKFPLYTKEQVEDLKNYLKEITPQKEVEYLG